MSLFISLNNNFFSLQKNLLNKHFEIKACTMLISAMILNIVRHHFSPSVIVLSKIGEHKTSKGKSNTFLKLRNQFFFGKLPFFGLFDIVNSQVLL